MAKQVTLDAAFVTGDDVESPLMLIREYSAISGPGMMSVILRGAITR